MRPQVSKIRSYDLISTSHQVTVLGRVRSKLGSVEFNAFQVALRPEVVLTGTYDVAQRRSRSKYQVVLGQNRGMSHLMLYRSHCDLKKLSLFSSFIETINRINIHGKLN